MAKKKKHKGHYCKICCSYKSNESFTGKGHAQHICKTCMSAIKKGKTMEDDLPDLVLENRETTRFKKLNKEQKADFKSLAVSVTIEYWREKRQIPFGENMTDIRKKLIEAFIEEYEILLKEDTELKNYLQCIIIPTINKQLKAEMAEQQIKNP